MKTALTGIEYGVFVDDGLYIYRHVSLYYLTVMSTGINLIWRNKAFIVNLVYKDHPKYDRKSDLNAQVVYIDGCNTMKTPLKGIKFSGIHRRVVFVDSCVKIQI